jgi:proteic killer suppression protein
VIKSFKHKGLEKFFRTGTTKGIQAKHADKLERILDFLHAADEAQEMNLPGFNLHPLIGTLKDHWSVKVSGNWRVTFYFEDGHAYVVNYLDYH